MNDLLKFITCGSVDDGKSTLIGHLLYDAKLIYADQEEALMLDSKVGSRGGEIDYSLLLDGLLAEREQGITIDVAYRYFTTDNRSFICADTPGHEEYTRNMACGASFADLAIILVDATQGVLTQTRRHARICALMGIRYFIFAINKMDLIQYGEKQFQKIEKEIKDLQKELSLENIMLIPVSATEGDNVTKKSNNMPWYNGPTLLTYLEQVDITQSIKPELGFYMPVQRVCRPNHDFRGFQGQIEGGCIDVGDTVTSQPSGEEAIVKQIYVADKKVNHAFIGQPVTIQLNREVDVSRGCILENNTGLQATDSFQAELLWMDDKELSEGKNFIILLGTKKIPGILTKINYRINVNTGEHIQCNTLKKNEIASVDIAVTEPIVLDLFKNHRSLGEFILIDRITNMTSACGTVSKIKQTGDNQLTQVSTHLRGSLNWQKPYIITINKNKTQLSDQDLEKLEFALLQNSRHVYLYKPESKENYNNVATHLYDAGLIVLLVLDNDFTATIQVSDKISLEELTKTKDNSTVDSLVNKILKLTAINMLEI